MSITNRSVNRKASTADLEALYAEYEESYNDHLTNGYTPDGAHMEWLESGMELIDDELAKREEEGQHYDSPSLQDRGYELGSYAS